MTVIPFDRHPVDPCTVCLAAKECSEMPENGTDEEMEAWRRKVDQAAWSRGGHRLCAGVDG